MARNQASWPRAPERLPPYFRIPSISHTHTIPKIDSREVKKRKSSPQILPHDPIRILVPERQHAAPRMLDQHNLRRAQQLLADDDGAQRVDGRGARLIAPVPSISTAHTHTRTKPTKHPAFFFLVWVVRSRSYVANDVGVAELDAKGLGRVDAGVHAGQDEVLLGRGQGEVALGEGRGVGGRGRFDVLLDGRHVWLLFLLFLLCMRVLVVLVDGFFRPGLGEVRVWRRERACVQLKYRDNQDYSVYIAQTAFHITPLTSPRRGPTPWFTSQSDKGGLAWTQ